jgi:hypothetical protein
MRAGDPSSKNCPCVAKGREAGFLFPAILRRMKRVIDSTEVLGTVETATGVCSLCAAADAKFDDSAGKMVVALHAFLRPVEVSQKVPSVDWLPADETVSMSVDMTDAWDAAKEIFHRWVHRVRDSAPLALHPS